LEWLKRIAGEPVVFVVGEDMEEIRLRFFILAVEIQLSSE
jgi:hypothetical protein